MVSHFMLFSGVTCPKSALMRAAFCPDVRRPWSVATPKYFLPCATNFALRELAEELPVGPLAEPVEDTVEVTRVVVGVSVGEVAGVVVGVVAGVVAVPGIH
jgi:hypothetical protein